MDKGDPTLTKTDFKIDKSCSTGQVQLTGQLEIPVGDDGSNAKCTIVYDDPIYVGDTVGCSTDIRVTPSLVQLFEDAVAAIQQTSPANPTATFLADALSQATCLIAGGGAVEFTTDLADYQAAVSGLNETVQDFERRADGTEFPPTFRAVRGFIFLHQDAVTFESSPASTQVFPENFPRVILAVSGGNAAIASSAGGGKFSSFNTIQSRFSSPVAAASFFFGGGVSDVFLVEVVTSDGAERASPTLSIPLPRFVGVLSTCRDNRIDLVRLIPGAAGGPFGTGAGWSMSEMRFSKEF